MSEAMSLNDALKAATATTDLANKHALLTTSTGAMEKAIANVLGVDFVRKNAQGAAILALGMNLVVAVDRANPSAMVAYLAWRGETGNPTTQVLFSNGLTLGAKNNQGTNVVNGGEDVVQYCLRLGDLT